MTEHDTYIAELKATIADLRQGHDFRVTQLFNLLDECLDLISVIADGCSVWYEEGGIADRIEEAKELYG